VNLLQLVWVAPVAAVLVTAAFSFCVLGVARAGERRAAGQPGVVAAWMALAAVSGLVFVGSILAGIAVIVTG
jgi:hypothetical protein